MQIVAITYFSVQLGYHHFRRIIVSASGAFYPQTRLPLMLPQGAQSGCDTPAGATPSNSPRNPLRRPR